MITVRNVSKILSGKQIITNISCQIEHGVLHIGGDNGSGKSTLLRMMAGSLEPDKGRIWVSDKDIFKKENHQIKKNIGYIPDLAPIAPFLTGAQFLKFICRVKASEWPNELIGAFNLEQHLNTCFQSMSYGTKKKFLCVSGLLACPQYLILDEPINGLDQPAMSEMYKILSAHLERKNGICVIVTHDASWIDGWRERFSCQTVVL